MKALERSTLGDRFSLRIRDGAAKLVFHNRRCIYVPVPCVFAQSHIHLKSHLFSRTSVEAGFSKTNAQVTYTLNPRVRFSYCLLLICWIATVAPISYTLVVAPSHVIL